MTSKSGKKQVVIQSSSLAALTQNSDHSATKKAISTEQISFEGVQSEFERQASQYQIAVPFQVNIKALIKHLRVKMLENESIYLLFCDQKAGQILVQQKPSGSCILNCLDCLCFFRKQGWPKKGISQTFEAISITVKRQYIEESCKIGIRGNCSRTKSSKRMKVFIEQIIQFVRKALQTFKDMKQYPQIKQLQHDSPLGFQINAIKKIEGIFIEGNTDQRLKTLYDTNIMKIKAMISQYSEVPRPPKMKLSELINKIVTQSNTLFNSLCNTPGVSSLGLHQDYSLYAIESMFCYTFFKDIFEIYRSDLKANCEEFSGHAKYINENLTNSQYFDYLEVRPRYRLPKSRNPYQLAIASLRNLEYSTTLREVLLCVQRTFSLIKIACLSEHNGKIEISSMDDILPVMIFVVAKAQVSNFPVYVKLVDDYIRIRNVFELEQRVATTLYVAAEDICKKLPNIPKSK